MPRCQEGRDGDEGWGDDNSWWRKVVVWLVSGRPPRPDPIPEGPRAHSPPLSRFLAGLTARFLAACESPQLRARPAPASAPPTWPRDRTSTSPGRSAGFTSQSEPAEQLRSSASPNQRLLGSLAPPTPRPGAGSFLSLLPREAILTCRAQGFATRLVLPSPTPGPSSAQLLHDHAVPHLHTQMAEDLVTRITFPWRDSLGGSAGVQHRALTLVLRTAWKST